MSDLSPDRRSARLSTVEFTALLAMLFATIAFSIDAMLPALPAIAADLTPDAVNRAQLILSAFVMGLGVGTFFTGPLSDAFGRKSVMATGLGLYVASALAAHYATSLPLLLAARFVQGLGASAPRIGGMALTRDLYEGREMARITSFVMMVFMLVPAVAPMIGQGITHLWGWRAVFLAFMLFGLTALVWMGLRQPETLPPSARRPLSPALLRAGLVEVLSDRPVLNYTLVTTLGLGQLFGLLSSIQQIFDQGFGRGAEFPYWFALIALLAGGVSFVNGLMVTRFGMRRMVTMAYVAQAIIAATACLLTASGLVSGGWAFAVFFLWAASVFFTAGLSIGNLNALALQNMGHIAGMANSVISAISTVLATLIAGPVGLAFDGTPVPAMIAALVCSALAALLMRATARSPGQGAR